MTEVAILGGGNGGLSAAADLGRRGHQVRLFSRSRELAGRITANETMHLCLPTEKVVVDVPEVSNDLETAIRGADVVMLAVPATALDDYARALAPLMNSSQILFLNPGGTGGALAFAATMTETRSVGLPPICETSTLTYGCRVDLDRGEITISNIAPRVPFAVLPGHDQDAVHRVLLSLYPSLVLKSSVLETGLSNLNAVEHPAQALLNAGRIEDTKGDFFFYREGTTPSVGRVIDRVDLERRALASALGIDLPSFVDLFCEAGYTTRQAAATGSAYEALQASEANWNFRSPPSLDHRYVHEDVGRGLVPWTLWAAEVGVDTPVMDSLVTLAGAATGVDYRTEGLTLRKMGLAHDGDPQLRRALGLLRDPIGSGRRDDEG